VGKSALLAELLARMPTTVADTLPSAMRSAIDVKSFAQGFAVYAPKGTSIAKRMDDTVPGVLLVRDDCRGTEAHGRVAGVGTYLVLGVDGRHAGHPRQFVALAEWQQPAGLLGRRLDPDRAAGVLDAHVQQRVEVLGQGAHRCEGDDADDDALDCQAERTLRRRRLRTISFIGPISSDVVSSATRGSANQRDRSMSRRRSSACRHSISFSKT
jgi:hypothetical protein